MSDQRNERDAVEQGDGAPAKKESPERAGTEDRPDLKEHGKADAAKGTDA
ncbi:hypothetical protein [Paractinoplanes atraurantiacus]|nr:hypothetical protein [Actinoplanes atraurantiacus]